MRVFLSSQPVTDAEKHSASTAVHQAWSGDEMKRPDGGSDSGVRMESGSKWSRRNPSDISDESDKGGSGRKTPSVSHTGSWRRGMSTQVGVTSPRTKNTSSTGSTGSVSLKTHSSGNIVYIALFKPLLQCSQEKQVKTEHKIKKNN